jgi:hypothetical protein
VAWKLAGAGRPTTTAPPNRRAAAPTGRWSTPPHTPDSKSSYSHPAAPQLDAPVVIVSWSVPTATTAPAVTGAASTQPTVTRSLAEHRQTRAAGQDACQTAQEQTQTHHHGRAPARHQNPAQNHRHPKTTPPQTNPTHYTPNTATKQRTHPARQASVWDRDQPTAPAESISAQPISDTRDTPQVSASIRDR